MTFIILAVTAMVLTIVSIKFYNLLFSFAAALMWLALWMYNLNYPPGNIVIGSTIFDAINYSLIIMMIATMFIYFRERGKRIREANIKENKNGENVNFQSRGLMDMSNEEYRAMIHKRLHPHR